jgi:hypothetical protein
MTDILPEIPYSEATGDVKDIYDRLMTLTGVGAPALIYRHFAMYDGMLPWVWQIVGPEIESGTLITDSISATRHVPAVRLPPITEKTFSDTDVDQEAQNIISDMLATYNRMNPVNLCVVSAIRNILANEPVGDHVAGLKAALPLPPIVSSKLPAPLPLETLSQELQQTIRMLSAKIPSPGATVIPTLYRHLAIWPDFLMKISPSLADAIDRGDVETRMRDVTDGLRPIVAALQTRAVAKNLGEPPISNTAEMVETLDAFLYTIPQLIVIGRALEAAIAPQAD